MSDHWNDDPAAYQDWEKTVLRQILSGRAPQIHPPRTFGRVSAEQQREAAEPGYVVRGTVQGPRWISAEPTIRGICHMHGVKCELERHTSLLHQVILLTLRGKRGSVNEASKAIKECFPVDHDPKR